MISKCWVDSLVAKYVSRAQKYYSGPFAKLPASSRGNLIEKIVRDFYHESINATQDPSKEFMHANGLYSHDFLDVCTGERVEVKSSKLSFSKNEGKHSSTGNR